MLTYILFLFAVVCSVFSQHPLIAHGPIAPLLNYSWGLPMLYIILQNFGKTRNESLIQRYIYFGLLITFYIQLCVFFRTQGFSLDLDVYYILISLLIAYTSYLFWRSHSSEKFLSIMCMCLLIAVPIIAYTIYDQFIAHISLASIEYAYGDKNSIATIILATLVLCYYNFHPKNKFIRIIYLIVAVGLIVMIFLLKSRATLLGLFAILFWIVITQPSKKYRLYLAVAFVIAAILIMTNEHYYTVIVDNILLANRSANDLSSLSSGRWPQIVAGIELFIGNPLFGVGKTYVDCFPIAMLSSFGLIGFMIIFVFLFSVGKTICSLDKSNPIYCSTFILFFIFMINCLFEAHTPFGPGVKCFLLWMLFGFSSAELSMGSENEE